MQACQNLYYGLKALKEKNNTKIDQSAASMKVFFYKTVKVQRRKRLQNLINYLVLLKFINTYKTVKHLKKVTYEILFHISQWKPIKQIFS